MKLFITGSTDGLGLLAAKKLVEKGHQVILHGRNEERAKQALEKIPSAAGYVTADLRDIEQTKELADKVNAFGKFDAIIHNAGVYQASSKDIITVNTLAPYILTCLIKKPKRLIYLSSDMHLVGSVKLERFKNDFEGLTYSDSKLHVLLLCKIIAGKYPDIFSNAVNPGWVPTKMGGQGAPDDLDQGTETQVWLSVSEDEKAKVSGKYFFHQCESRYNNQADDPVLQKKFFDRCRELTGVEENL